VRSPTLGPVGLQGQTGRELEQRSGRFGDRRSGQKFQRFVKGLVTARQACRTPRVGAPGERFARPAAGTFQRLIKRFEQVGGRRKSGASLPNGFPLAGFERLFGGKAVEPALLGELFVVGKF
jgi:hypothetical protein